MAQTARHTAIATLVALAIIVAALALWKIKAVSRCCSSASWSRPRCLAAGALAVGVSLTVDWHTALGAGITVLVLRQIEDYVIVPRVLGHAVGPSPLGVLVSVAAGLLFGGFYVLLAVPIAAVLATLVDVLLRDRDSAEEDVPAVLFPARDAEAG